MNAELSTALGASEVTLLELASVYRAIASGVLARPHIIARVTDLSGGELYQAPRETKDIGSPALRAIQEGLRGVVRLPDGTAHSLDNRNFPIQVLGKTGTTSGFRDALFVGSTYGPSGITVAVRIGFDDNRSLGNRETGARTAMPIFREIMLQVYQAELAGPAPRFPAAIEAGIDQYLASQAVRPLTVAQQGRGLIALAPFQVSSAEQTAPRWAATKGHRSPTLLARSETLGVGSSGCSQPLRPPHDRALP